jgi:hypothetical protein
MLLNRQELPKQNNFYSSFRGVSKVKVKEVLEKNGWSSRNCSWTDYELTNDWSELVLEGDDEEPLLNGAVVYIDKSIETLDKIFKTLGGYFIYEFNDDNKNLVLEKRNDS